MINIAELLKDAPKGMKLYSPLFGECKLKCIEDEMFIHVKARYLHDFKFDEYGQLPDLPIGANINGECLLFPSKEARTWEGWNQPVEQKFKVGDEIKTGSTIETIAEIDCVTRSYCCESGRTIWFENQDLWHLAPKPHYDIANFHAGMPVLVRDYDNTQWRYVQFSHCVGKDNPIMFNACGNTWKQCIPFEGNEHLLGTTDMPSEEYINW